MMLDLNAQSLAEIDDIEARAATLREQGDDAGAAKLDGEAATKRAELQTEIDALDEYRLDDERLEPLGIGVDDKWADADDVLGTTPVTPTTPAAETVPPGTKVIDMEPEIIEGTPPKVIDMEPEIIEGTPPKVIDMEPEVIEGTPPTVIDMEPEVIEVPAPTAEANDFQEDLSQIAQVEQQLDQLDELDS